MISYKANLSMRYVKIVSDSKGDSLLRVKLILITSPTKSQNLTKKIATMSSLLYVNIMYMFSIVLSKLK